MRCILLLHFFVYDFILNLIFHRQPARFLPSKSKSSHRTSGRSRRLRQSSASSRSPSQSGEDYYTTDDEGQRRKHRSKSRKGNSIRIVVDGEDEYQTY